MPQKKRGKGAVRAAQVAATTAARRAAARKTARPPGHPALATAQASATQRPPTGDAAADHSSDRYTSRLVREVESLKIALAAQKTVADNAVAEIATYRNLVAKLTQEIEAQDSKWKKKMKSERVMKCRARNELAKLKRDDRRQPAEEPEEQELEEDDTGFHDQHLQSLLLAAEQLLVSSTADSDPGAGELGEDLATLEEQEVCTFAYWLHFV